MSLCLSNWRMVRMQLSIWLTVSKAGGGLSGSAVKLIAKAEQKVNNRKNSESRKESGSERAPKM